MSNSIFLKELKNLFEKHQACIIYNYKNDRCGGWREDEEIEIEWLENNIFNYLRVNAHEGFDEEDIKL